MAAKGKKRQLKCLRCGREWNPRRPKPVTCPACNSPYWNSLPRRKADAENTIRYKKADAEPRELP